MSPAAAYFVIVSGLPGSGKTTLARRMAPVLGLPVLDKDDELDALFAARGIGDRRWRRDLSRESDDVFRRKALASTGAILVSFWHLPGMDAESGTPTRWLDALPGPAVHLWCRCPAEVASDRFLARRRHPGHLDLERSDEETVAEFAALQRLEPLEFGPCVPVDTTATPEVDALADRILVHVGAS